MKLLILDLDGTIRQTRSGKKFINDPQDQRIIEGVQEVLEVLSEDYWIIGCSNQGGVEAGYKTLEDAIAEQKITLQLLGYEFMKSRGLMEGIVFAPSNNVCYLVSPLHVKIPFAFQGEAYKRYSAYGFRKPNIGMVEYIRNHVVISWGLSVRPFTKEETVMIGDMESDRICAENAGIPFKWNWQLSELIDF